MKCTVCQFENQDNLEFCEKCENELGRLCPKCSNVNPSGSKFCNECGNDLKNHQKPPLIDYHQPYSYTPEYLAEKIRLTKNVIEGELKIVTVLFADMANSTALFENLDPEDVHDIMDGCFKIMVEEIHKYEGTITQFMGDGIMAIFGAPLAHEDHAQRACSATLEIQKALKAYSVKIRDKYNIEFKMRFGLNSGPVIVGAVGDDLRMDYTAEGDTVNLASRLETMAQPGTILVSNNIYSRVGQQFVIKTLGKLKIKGKEKAQDVYQLLDRTPQSLISSERMIQSELVNREQEINRLEALIVKAKNGEGSIISIIGEAGIGKSRLIAELKRREVIKDTLILEGRALSIGRNLSFYPIIEIIKSLANITDDITQAEAAHRLESIIMIINPEQAHEIFPFAATMIGLKLTGKHAERVKEIEGEALEKLIQKNLRDLIARVSESKTLIFIIEDLHWADTSSIELLKTLFRLAKDNRILFINLFRPYHKDTAEILLNTVIENYPNQHTAIYIQPLDTTLSNLLIDNLLKIKGLPQNVKDLIHRRSEGNPFFIEEIARSFIDKGAVVLKDGSFMFTKDIESTVIPKNIQELLMSRIDRLDNQSKSLIKIASVIGRNFFYKILRDVADIVDNIDQKLQYLERVQLIRKGKRMGEVEYLFKHAIVQETAYESILRRKRKDLHLKVAESIEKNFKERLHEFYGMLAYHYGIGENIDKTEEYLIKAGEVALKSSALSEALHYYKEAHKIYQTKYGETADDEKIATFDKNIALTLYNRGQYDEAVEYFDKALNYYWGKLPKHAFFVILKFVKAFSHFLISLYLPIFKFRKTPTQRDYETIGLFFKKIKALSMIDPMRFFLEYLYLSKKVTDFNLVEFKLGLEIFVGTSTLFSFTGISFRLSRKILDFAKGKVFKDNAKTVIIYDIAETVHNYLKGNWKAIKNYDDDLVKINLSLGEIYDVSHHLYWHGFLNIYYGYFDKADLIVNRLNDIFEVYENDLTIQFKYEINTNLLIEHRNLDNALTEIEEGISFAKKACLADLNGFLIEMYPYQSWIYTLKGNIDKAKESLQEAEKIKQELKDAVPFQLSNFYRSQLEYDLYQLKESIQKGNKSKLFEYMIKAFNSSKMLLRISRKAAKYRTVSYKLTGVYYWLINKQEKALKWWKKAIKEGERLGARLQLSRTYFEIGKRLLEPESKYNALNGIKPEEYLENAKKLFEEMGLQWDLNELDQVRKC